MKLQAKISLTLIVSVLIATALSFVLINILAALFDKSYSWNDLEKIAVDASRELAADWSAEPPAVAEKLRPWKAKHPNLEFSLFNQNRELIFRTNPEPPHKPELDQIRRRLAENQDRAVYQDSLRFIDTIDRSPYMVRKPVINDGFILGVLMVSVRNDFFLPFYIRINQEKILDSYLILFAAITAMIALSFLLVFLFTSPLIGRLRTLYAAINGFQLKIPGVAVADPRNDEIGFIRNTFNTMAARIREDYAERERFFTERQELLRNISHDFRTPLTSILGYSISLEEGVYDNEEERRRYISIIRKKAEYMTKLFNEMMELTRLDNADYALNKTRFNLSELVRETVIEYLPQLEREGFEIESDMPETLEVHADKERLSRAIRNLIENVVTHASNGKFIGITLSVTADGQVRLTIADRGPGIPGQEQELIFKRFFSGSGKGTGLGLAIAREIAEKHGGTITVEADDKRGSRFTISLPTGEGAEPRA